MERLTTTPFGRRPVTAGLLATQALAQATPALPRFPKWELFHDLCTARAVFGVTDRDLTVLNALLSFHPGDELDDGGNLVVFPSNRTLSARAHGMAESTLRRHLAALCGAGLLLRHDSPNGKRYAARGAGGAVLRAFGFDLRPLLVRADEIARAAQAVHEAEARLRRLRERCTLALRDAGKLIDYALCDGLCGDWDGFADRLAELRRGLRRKADPGAMAALADRAERLLAEVRTTLSEPPESEDSDGNDVDSGRHQQSSKTDPSDSEPCHEDGRAATATPRTEAALPLALILRACPGMLAFADRPIRGWPDLVAVMAMLRPMLGISPDAWAAAVEVMGARDAATVLAAMVERSAEIRNPGGYLRALTQKAAAGAFSPGPMVMACLNRTDRAAA